MITDVRCTLNVLVHNPEVVSWKIEFDIYSWWRDTLNFEFVFTTNNNNNKKSHIIPINHRILHGTVTKWREFFRAWKRESKLGIKVTAFTFELSSKNNYRDKVSTNWKIVRGSAFKSNNELFLRWMLYSNKIKFDLHDNFSSSDYWEFDWMSSNKANQLTIVFCF